MAAETDPKGSIAEPNREHRSSTDHSAYGQCDGKSAAASHPDDLQDAGKPAPVAGLCVRGRIGDQVIQQDPERGETDCASQVRHQDQDADQPSHDDFGVMRHLMTFMHGGQPAWKIIMACHRQRGSANACDQGEKGAERCGGRSQPDRQVGPSPTRHLHRGGERCRWRPRLLDPTRS